MTSAEWLASTDPARMLAYLTAGPREPPARGWTRTSTLPQASDRRLRLFAVACCRQVWDQLTDPRSRRAVEVAERYADGLATKEDFRRANREAYNVWGAAQGPDADRVSPAWAVTTVAPDQDGSPASDLWGIFHRQGCTFATQAALLRDIFGNPWKPVRCPECCRGNVLTDRGDEDCKDCGGTGGIPLHVLSWNNGVVQKLAQMIYEERAWWEMSKLADALFDAGCTDADILAHCRGEGVRVRGDWVLDLLLGKE